MFCHLWGLCQAWSLEPCLQVYSLITWNMKFGDLIHPKITLTHTWSGWSYTLRGRRRTKGRGAARACSITTFLLARCYLCFSFPPSHSPISQWDHLAATATETNRLSRWQSTLLLPNLGGNQETGQKRVRRRRREGEGGREGGRERAITGWF